jgi:hypothetical protein
MKTIITLTLIAVLPTLANAGVIFSDDFEANFAGINVTPSGWTITNGGTVDILGTGCHSGNACVDLDGSSLSAGVLQRTFNAHQGTTYNLIFWLAGSQRNDDNIVDVTLGSALLSAAFVASNQPAIPYVLSWTASTTGLAALSFHNWGGDNTGAVLDDVVLFSNNPEPGTFILLAAGLVAVAAARRRRA